MERAALHGNFGRGHQKDRHQKRAGWQLYQRLPPGHPEAGEKRIRNGEIAFINEYGAPGRGIEARPAIMAATAKNEQKTVDAGERVYHAYLGGKNL